MYNSITGLITFKGTDHLFLDQSGLEWELHVSRNTLEKTPSVGSRGKVFTYLHHNDTVHQLYGFGDEDERRLFLELIKVSGIGPKAALKILGGMGLSQLQDYLDSGNVDALATIPGLGKKTAQKLVLALKGKLSFGSPGDPSGSGDSEIVLSLVQMGYERKAVIKTITALLQDFPQESKKEEWLFREAIVRLSQ